MSEYDQYSNPKGEAGREVIRTMYKSHLVPLTWMISIIPDRDYRNILDVGCGGGYCLHCLLEKYPDAECVGIDISEESVKATSEYNSEEISSGRLKVKLGEVSHIPADNESFDLVTATSTYVFWPDLPNDIKEIASKLRKGGLLVITGNHPAGVDPATMGGVMANMLPTEKMFELMRAAGFEPYEKTLEFDRIDPDERALTHAYIGVKQ